MVCERQEEGAKSMEYLVVDVGGSAIKYAVMDDSFSIKGQGTRGGRPDSHDAFVDAICDLYAQASAPQGGIAISYCGEVDEALGEVLAGGSYQYNAGTNLKSELEGRLVCPVSIENDGNCAALAELAAGSLRGRRNAVVIVVGTGLGGGIIIDDKVYHGSHKFSGGFSLLTTSLEADLGDCHGYTDAPVVKPSSPNRNGLARSP